MQSSRRSVLVWAGLGMLGVSACRRASAPELVYVSAEESGEIVVVDSAKAKVVARFAVGKRPRGLKVGHDGKLLYVALSGSPRGGPNVDESKLPPADRSKDGVGVVDLEARKLLRTLPSGQDPESFDLSLDGKTLYISNEETAELSFLDLGAGKLLGRVNVGAEPEGVTLRPDGKIVYVTSEAESAVDAVDTATRAVVKRVATGQRPRSIAFTPDGKLGFVTNELDASVTVVDAANHAPLGTIAIEASGPAQRPMGAVISRDGKRLFVSTGRGGAVAAIDVEKRAVTKLITEVGTRPWGIALSRDGKRLYTANGPSNDVSIIDVATGKIEQRVKVGGLPWGVAVG